MGIAGRDVPRWPRSISIQMISTRVKVSVVVDEMELRARAHKAFELE